MECQNCEYETLCFTPLSMLNRARPGYCKQGRRKREYKAKAVTLREVIDASANSDNPVP